METTTKEQVPRLSEKECQVIAFHGLNAGQVSVRMCREVTTKELREAFKFYGITYRRKNNHPIGKRLKPRT